MVGAMVPLDRWTYHPRRQRGGQPQLSGRLIFCAAVWRNCHVGNARNRTIRLTAHSSRYVALCPYCR